MKERIDILIIEDSASDAELETLVLKEEGLARNIKVLEDGQAALDFVSSNEFCKQPPRVVLLDLKLPRVSGLDVLRGLKADARTRAVPVVILTSSNQESERKAAYDLGANGFVQKPIVFEEFEETMRGLGVFWLSINLPAGGQPGLTGEAR